MSDALGYSFDHVHIYCTDLPATEKWFVDQMGGRLIRKRVVGGAQAADVEIGGAQIFLRQQASGEQLGASGPSRFGTDHFGLKVADLDATAAELKKRGVQFDMEPRQNAPGLKICFVKGPDSIRIEILQRD